MNGDGSVFFHMEYMLVLFDPVYGVFGNQYVKSELSIQKDEK